MDEATLERCPCDFPHFAERHLKVRNERGELVPLILSKVQLEIMSWEGCRSRREAAPGDDTVREAMRASLGGVSDALR